MPAFVHIGRFVVNVDHITHISFVDGKPGGTQPAMAVIHTSNGDELTFYAHKSPEVYKALERLRESAPGLDAVVSYGAVDKHGFLDFNQLVPESEE